MCRYITKIILLEKKFKIHRRDPEQNNKMLIFFQLTNLITWLGYVNSTLNPIIYTIFNMDFRVAFKRIISGVAFRN